MFFNENLQFSETDEFCKLSLIPYTSTSIKEDVFEIIETLSLFTKSEDFEITDEMRRKPNAAGGRVGYQEGKTVLPKAKPEKVLIKNKMEDFEHRFQRGSAYKQYHQ